MNLRDSFHRLLKVIGIVVFLCELNVVVIHHQEALLFYEGPRDHVDHLKYLVVSHIQFKEVLVNIHDQEVNSAVPMLTINLGVE